MSNETTTTSKQPPADQPSGKPQPEQPPATPEQRLAELTDTLKRVQADFENYRKQVEKRNEEFKKTATKQVLKNLLPIVDLFEIALKHTDNAAEFQHGMTMIFGQFQAMLEKEGVKPIDAAGKPFDKTKHEAIAQIESNQPPNTIIEQVQKGYELHGTLLRAARVKISKPKEQTEPNTQTTKKEPEPTNQHKKGEHQ